MLVDHAHSLFNGILGGVKRYLLPEQNNLPRVCRMHPIENFHQGRFARPILPYNSMNGISLDRQGDVPVGV